MALLLSKINSQTESRWWMVWTSVVRCFSLITYMENSISLCMYVSCFLNLSIILDISIWYIHLMNESLAVRLSVINIHTRCTMHWQNIIGRIGLLLQIRAISISAIQFRIDVLVVKSKKHKASIGLCAEAGPFANKNALPSRHLILTISPWSIPRTTDAQRGNSLHCTAENSLPLPNF